MMATHDKEPVGEDIFGDADAEQTVEDAETQPVPEPARPDATSPVWTSPDWGESGEQKGTVADEPPPEDEFGPVADEPKAQAVPPPARARTQAKRQRRVTAADIKACAAANPEQAYRQAGYTGQLKKAGNHLLGLCALHEETTASFTITLTGDKAGLFFCFGCGAGGSVIDFVKQLENLPTDGEAITRSAELLGLTGAAPPPRKRSTTRKVAAPSKPLSVKIAEKHCDILLAKKNRKHLDRFLEARALSRETIERAGIGYDGDRFTIPIYDETGRLLLDIRRYKLGAKRLKMLPWLAADEEKGIAGTGSTKIFGWQYVKDEEVCVLAEGELDALALVQRGIPAFSATNGAGQWPDEPPDLTGMTIHICGDNNGAGDRMKKKLPPKLYAAGAEQVFVVAWPPDAAPGYDVTDYFLDGGTADGFRGLMSKAEAVERPDQETEQGLAAKVEAAIGADAPQMHRTDTGNAEHLVAAHGDNIRYCWPWAKWLAWTGKVWRVDAEGNVLQLAKRTVQELYGEAAKLADDKERKALATHAMSSESANRRRAMVFLAQSEPPVACDHTDFDTDPWLFNCENGTIDLRTGKPREHRREDYLTKIAPVEFDPDAKCPKWLAFLDGIFAGNANVIQFVQRAAGYSLTGDVTEDALFFAHGGGSNGKTTFLLTLQELGGPYAAEISPGLLLTRRYEAHPTALADLFGIRLAVSEEVGEGRRFDEERLRYITGGSPIKARRMREDPWEFPATHKIWLAANQKPKVTGDDYAIWRRIKLIPFNVQFTDPGDPGPDKDLSLRQDLFRDERAGILNWALEGCQSWQSDGLKPPREVQDATAEYREEEDVVQQFIEAECVVKPDARANPTALYKAFTCWAKDTGATKLSSTAFGRRLTDKGFKSGTIREGDSSNRWRQGIGLGI